MVACLFSGASTALTQPSSELVPAGIGMDRYVQSCLVASIARYSIDGRTSRQQPVGGPQLTSVAGLPERLVELLT